MSGFSGFGDTTTGGLADTNEPPLATLPDQSLPVPDPVTEELPPPEETKPEPEMFYFTDTRGIIYKAETRRNHSDTTIPFPGPDIEQHMPRDLAGNPVDTSSQIDYDAAGLTAASEALKYNPRFNSVNLSASIQDAAITAAAAKQSTTGIQSSNTVGATGNVQVSGK